MNLAVLGFVELSLGRDRAALPHFRPLLDWVSERKAASATHPVLSSAYPMEALVAAGELDEAAFELERLKKKTGRTEE